MARFILPGQGGAHAVGVTPPVYYFDDFVEGGYNATTTTDGAKFSTLANAAPWLVSLVDSLTGSAETMIVDDVGQGGHLAVTTNAADNDSTSAQLNGASFINHATNKLIFECRFKVDDILTTDWAVGMSAPSGSLIGANNLMVFTSADSTGDVDIRTNLAGSAELLDTGVDLVNDTFVTVRLEATTTKIEWFVDGSLEITSTDTDDIPILDLSPGFTVRVDGTGGAEVLTIDYIMVAQERA